MKEPSKSKRESYVDLKKELRTMKADLNEAVYLFKDEFVNFFNFKGDNLLKFYIVFVLILLPILLTQILGPFFFEAVE